MSTSLTVFGVLILSALSLSFADPSPDVEFCFSPAAASRAGLVTFEAASATELCSVLHGVWELVPAGEVPNIAPRSFPSDMGRLSAEDRKTVFIRSLAPHILERNRQILEERSTLLHLSERLRKGAPVSPGDREILAGFCRRYRVDVDDDSGMLVAPFSVMNELLCRVDEIPLGLAVGQAAVESAWGTSRLALNENSLFGQFVFASDDPRPPVGKGAIRPGLPARFRHIGEAVEAYARNLNTCGAYEPFRKIRASLRKKGHFADPVALAQGLLPYSELGAVYVQNVREVIRGNDLSGISRSSLARLRSTLFTAILGRPVQRVALQGDDGSGAELESRRMPLRG